MNGTGLSSEITSIVNHFVDEQVVQVASYHIRTTSTNDAVRDDVRWFSKNNPHAAGQATAACIANQQSQGRGQQGRRWMDSPNALLMSIDVPELTIAPSLRSGLLAIATGMVVAQSMIELLPELRHEIQLKWPNDVLLRQKKLGGILVERYVVSIDQKAHHRYVVGLGMNLGIPPQSSTEDPQVASAAGLGLPLGSRAHWFRELVVRLIEWYARSSDWDERQVLETLDTQCRPLGITKDQWESVS